MRQTAQDFQGMKDALPQPLKATPAILRGLMSEITEEDARWKPVPERFSIAEVLAHLSHSDGDCYRARLDRFLSEEMPEFEPDDAQMHLELYKNGDPEEDFGHFEEQPQSRIWVGEFRSEFSPTRKLAPAAETD